MLTCVQIDCTGHYFLCTVNRNITGSKTQNESNCKEQIQLPGASQGK